jgi:hypothetical protein
MIMDQDQTLDQRPNALATEPPALPIILRSQAARHLAPLSRAHLATSNGSRIAELMAFTFQTFADIETEDGRRLVHVQHDSLNLKYAVDHWWPHLDDADKVDMTAYFLKKTGARVS